MFRKNSFFHTLRFKCTRFLQDQSYYAVAQKKYVFIYDRDGVELHCLKAHVEPTRLEFLPYHWLLASIVSSPTSLLSFVYNNHMSGQRRLPKISRHLHRPAPLRTPDQARRMQHYGPKRAQRRYPSGAPERVCDTLDAEPPSPRGAAFGASGPRCERERGPKPGWTVYGDSREGRSSKGVGLSELEGGSEGLDCEECG